MHIILGSTLLVLLAEIGDKTMLLAILLVAKYRRPWPIIAGIFAATLLNHALAAWAGAEIAGLLDGFWFKLAVGIGFLVMAAWTLIPDKVDDDAADRGKAGASVFLTTAVAFFVAEMGDKTQLATVALGARYHSIELVAIGTTLGMMIANVPAVLLGERITRVIPIPAMRIAAAALLAGLGGWTLFELFR